MTREKKKYQLLTSENICATYKLLYKEGLVSFPLIQESCNKVEAIVANINSSYFGEEIYDSSGEKAVAYLYFIIKNHPFVDGNKRTACLVFSIVCDLNGLIPKYEGFSLDELAVFIENHKEKDHQEFIKLVARLLFK